MKIKYLSLFSGIGGFEYGIHQVLGDSAECVGYSEIDPYASSIYQYHYKDHINYGEATQINPKELPDFDLLVGGFPCQAFSVAGKRQGFDDTRGTLFFDIARILAAKCPANFILENVKGLLSHDSGKTFRYIITSLDELGYDVTWQVLNSKDFGVPQSRERVFIIGYLRGRSSRKISFRNGSDTQNSLQVICIGNVHPSGRGMNGNIYLTNSTICPTLTTNKGEGPKILNVKQLNQTNLKSNSNTQPYMQDRIYHTEDSIAPALNSFNEHNIAVDLKQLVSGRQGYRIYDARFLACTQSTLGGGMGAKTGMYATRGELVCTAKYSGKPQLYMEGDNVYLIDNMGVYSVVVRKLTPRECERLQGFPDDWTKYGKEGELISDTQRYKCLGNAVTTTVVADIVSRLFV